MSEDLYSIEVKQNLCTGKLACIRACPTSAIRYRNNELKIIPNLCIDCGECIVACPEGAIRARTDMWEDTKKFKFRIAIVSPTLFGQFPRNVTPVDIVNGLLAIGFDAVYDLSLESELYFKAIQEYLDSFEGPFPLLSSMCPVVVRLVQVSYPNMVSQVAPLQPPREIAGRNAKKKYAEVTGLKEEDIGAIYITPCPAKMASIKAPAEGVKSNLDIALGIRDIYNPLLAAITRVKKKDDDSPVLPPDQLNAYLFLSLVITGGLSKRLKQNRYITVAQLPNIIKVLEDIEKGKIRDIEFLECFACTGGCVGGPLTVDDRFVARSKLQKLMAQIQTEGRNIEDLVNEKYVPGDYFLAQPLKPRPVPQSGLNIIEQIEAFKLRDYYQSMLPGVNCGLCGAPTCDEFATDVAMGYAEVEDCILLTPSTVEKLRSRYEIPEEPEK